MDNFTPIEDILGERNDTFNGSMYDYAHRSPYSYPDLRRSSRNNYGWYNRYMYPPTDSYMQSYGKIIMNKIDFKTLVIFILMVVIIFLLFVKTK